MKDALELLLAIAVFAVFWLLMVAGIIGFFVLSARFAVLLWELTA